MPGKTTTAVALAVAALLTAAVAATATAATVEVGPVGQVGEMSAWRGHVVFSHRATPMAPWQLMEATTQGIRPLNVRPQRAGFGADVGPDAQGRPVAVFARCTPAGVTTNPESRCHIAQIALTGDPAATPRLVRALARPGYSDTAPGIWRGRIAFGRTLAGVRGTQIVAIFVQRRPGSRELGRLARGTVPQCGASACFRRAQPAQIDLGPLALAMTWSLAGGDAIPQEDEELWRVPLDGRPGTLLDVATMGECAMGSALSFTYFSSPSPDGRRVTYLRQAGDCWTTQSALVRTGPSPLQQRQHAIGARGGALAYNMARDGDRFWWIRGAPHPPAGDAELWEQCVTTPCTLVRSDDLRFTRARVRRRPQPPVGP